jgi:acetolactate synthase regulatory subunit
MTPCDPLPAPDADLLLEIDVASDDAALLRVVSTLHHRHARVRSLTFDGLGRGARVRVQVTGAATRSGTLVGALGRCVDVLSVRRLTTSEAVPA